MNEPSFAVFPCGKRVRWSFSGRTPNRLSASAILLNILMLCQGEKDVGPHVYVRISRDTNKRLQSFKAAHMMP